MPALVLKLLADRSKGMKGMGVVLGVLLVILLSDRKHAGVVYAFPMKSPGHMTLRAIGSDGQSIDRNIAYAPSCSVTASSVYCGPPQVNSFGPSFPFLGNARS